MAELAADLGRAGERAERDRLFAELGRLAARAQAYEPLERAEAEAAAAVDADGYTETWADVLRLQGSGREPASFAGIGRPVLLIHGADDPHPGLSTCGVLRRYLPQLEYVEIPRCGHEPWLERHGREPFLAALRAWMEQFVVSGGGGETCT
jgi:pimeloyl-ACP methyl ester carboxylesterase